SKDVSTSAGSGHLVSFLLYNQKSSLQTSTSFAALIFIKYVFSKVCKLYRFQAESQRWLLVREQMSETPLSLSLPKQLLSMLIQEHTDRVQEVTELGDLSPHWDGLRRDVISHCHHLIGCYQETLAELDKLSGESKFSAKSDRHLQFVPTNLHSQRMEVTNPDSVWYDVITFGAPADHHQAFKHGGLRRLLSKHTNHRYHFRLLSLHSFLLQQLFYPSRYNVARELLASVAQLQPLVFGLSEELLSVSLEVNVVQLQKTDQFVHTLKDELVKNALLAIHEQQTCSHADGNGLLCENLPANQEGPPSPGQADRRCDSEYDQEEWDRLWANVAKSLNCIIALVDRLRRQEDSVLSAPAAAASSSWQEQLLPLVLTLRDCVREAVTLARAALTFVVLQGALSASAAQGPPSLVQRRHAVFSQALSAVTLGFLLRLHEGLKDPQFLLQLHSVGILVQLEGLLNPYGDELGMLEDTEQSVSDLSRAAFTFTQAPSQAPTWWEFVVEVPLPPETFSLLPRELKDGCLIRVDAVLFNIGINQRSLAERFGDVSVQDRLNRQSFERLRSYCSALTARLPDLARLLSAGVRSLPDLLSSLDLSLQAKRRKKVEVLWIAATVCRQVNGVRLTSCKSAKDPTAMSVTLEQCLLLRRRHQLSRQSFSTALDSMRRSQKVANRKFSLSSVRLLAFPKSKDLQTTTVLFSHVNLLFGCRCFSS
uniref:Type II inositol 3,4-bisphosphate 4-phosphatase-like n=1 Tax=Stegastes partitus TaxID=144197 RepID=A0A3B4Z3V0_9TELE